MFLINSYCTKCEKTISVIHYNDFTIEIKCRSCNTVLLNIEEIKGYIYILSNPSMPNLVKIGYTTRKPHERVAEINASTGIPEPFKIEAAFHSLDPCKDEKIIHSALEKFRYNKNREFFSMETFDAVQKLKSILDIKPYNVSNQVQEKEKTNEKINKEKRSKLKLYGIYRDDPGTGMANYGLKCNACDKLFYSRYPKNKQVVCPHCFSNDIR